jgi:hypothetical protein
MKGIVMFRKKLLMVALCVTASSFAQAPKINDIDLRNFDRDTYYKISQDFQGKCFLEQVNNKQTEQRESAFRAFILSAGIGLGNSVKFGDHVSNHVIGYLLAGSANTLIGTLTVKDRNFLAQFLGISVGYAVGALIPTMVRN